MPLSLGFQGRIVPSGRRSKCRRRGRGMQASKPRDDIAPRSALDPSKFSISVAGPCEPPEAFDQPHCLIFPHQSHAALQVISEAEPREDCPLDTDRRLVRRKLRVEAGVRPVSAAIILGSLGVADGFAILVSGVAPTLLPFLRDAVDWQLAQVAVVLGTILGVNFLHLCGCYRLSAWHDLGGGIYKPIAGWLLTL